MTIITNSILRTSAYGTVPSDETQQISTTGLPVTVPFTTYDSKLIGSFVVTETIEGGFRLSASGLINYEADLMLWFSKKDYGKIDCSCQPGWWCGTGPGYFTFTQDLIENVWCSDRGGDWQVTTPKINVGDTIELWAYNRYMSSGTITLNEFTLKFTRAPELPLYVSAFGCKDEIVPGETSQITVHVTDDTGTPIEGATVNLSVPNGTLDLTSGTTDINGDFIPLYTAPTVTDIQTFTITATTSKSGYVDGSGSARITVITPANVISATLTVDKNDCVASCTVNGTVSWTNTGGTASDPTDLSITVNGVPTIVASAVIINPGETLQYTFQLLNLAADTYQICASPNSGTACQTVIVRTPANIVTTAITPSVTTCTAPCNMTVDITWTNNGGTSGTFIPTIITDGVPYPLTSESLGAELSITKTFTLTGLAVGVHTICSEPNTFPCVIVTVTSGKDLTALAIGGIFGFLIFKGIDCEDRGTKEECDELRDYCRWVEKEKKCVRKCKEGYKLEKEDNKNGKVLPTDNIKRSFKLKCVPTRERPKEKSES